jgi:hypothetical protein
VVPFWEVVETLLEGGGNGGVSSSSLFFPIFHEVNNLYHEFLTTMMFYLTAGQVHRAK